MPCDNWDCCVQKRKELTKGDFRTKHTNWGHLLLGIGVLIGVEGPVNTYLRAGDTTCPTYCTCLCPVMPRLKRAHPYVENIGHNGIQHL